MKQRSVGEDDIKVLLWQVKLEEILLPHFALGLWTARERMFPWLPRNTHKQRLPKFTQTDFDVEFRPKSAFVTP